MNLTFKITLYKLTDHPTLETKGSFNGTKPTNSLRYLRRKIPQNEASIRRADEIISIEWLMHSGRKWDFVQPNVVYFILENHDQRNILSSTWDMQHQAKSLYINWIISWMDYTIKIPPRNNFRPFIKSMKVDSPETKKKSTSNIKTAHCSRCMFQTGSFGAMSILCGIHQASSWFNHGPKNINATPTCTKISSSRGSYKPIVKIFVSRWALA